MTHNTNMREHVLLLAFVILAANYASAKAQNDEQKFMDDLAQAMETQSRTKANQSE